MSIPIIDKFKPKNNGKFKIADSCDVEYTNKNMEGVTDVNAALNFVYDILNAAPALSYIDEDGYREGQKKYWAIGENMNLIFNFSSSAAGVCTITIARDGITYRTLTSPKGRISVDLGTASSSASYTYTVSALDSLGRDAEQTLTFTHVVGGVTLSSTYADELADTVYTANKSEVLKIPFSINYAEEGYERHIEYEVTNSIGTKIITGDFSAGNKNIASIMNVPITFPSIDTYTIKLTGRVDLEGGDKLYSSAITYSFAVIQENSIATTVITDFNTELTTNDNIAIVFRTVTNIAALSGTNTMKAYCKLYLVSDTGSSTLIKNTTISNISSGASSTWTIGRLSTVGKYHYEIQGDAAGGAGNINYLTSTGDVQIKASAYAGSTYETSNLLAYFDANDMDNNDEHPEKWVPHGYSSTMNDYYYFKLHNLNYDSNGYITDTTDGSKMLKFTGDSYGELRHVNSNGVDSEYGPMSAMTNAATGNSLEILFRSRCVGEMNAKVLSCRNEAIANYGGYSLAYDKATISSNTESTYTVLAEDQWTHIVFVIDKNLKQLGIDVTNDNIEDMNPVYTMRIYINGVNSKCIGIPDNATFLNPPSYPAIQMILNAHLNTANGQIENFGASEIKMIRLYNGALTSSQILGNYINSFYDVEKREKVRIKNDITKADIPVIHFVRNRYRFSADKSFARLHAITTKQSDDPTIDTSKNSWVNCTMWYKYLDTDGSWKTVSYPDTDVYLQGTSTLQFPKKNYKTKSYKTTTDENGNPIRGGKYKFIPPNKSDKDGWHCKDSTYTIKCDFMEESHKNNTPSAMLYDEVLSKVIAVEGGEGSPARQETTTYTTTDSQNNEIEVTTNKCRDAIMGFPCMVYYNENEYIDSKTGEPLDYNQMSNELGYYYDNENDVMAGTMMFNTDKTSKSLGLEIDCDPVPITDTEGMPIEDIDGNEVVREILPCVSYEGASNANVAAATFYTLDEFNASIYKDYLVKYYDSYKLQGIIDSTMSYEDFYTKVQSGGYDGTAYSLIKADKYIADNGFDNWYDYIAATFDIRFSYTEDIETIDDDTRNTVDYDPIKNLIEWVASAYEDEKKFTTEFSEHFDLSYMIAYYLQMYFLTQVDNAGKNCMFDTWDGVKFYPRPYDMDTAMGKNNSGQDVIIESAEINPNLSPACNTGSWSIIASVSNTNDKSHNRYQMYNTTESKLWIAFGKYFKKQIVTCYGELRKAGIYNLDFVCSYVNALTSDIIGESFYNKDAAAKYLTQTFYTTDANGNKLIVSDMLDKLQGNWDSRYREYLGQRITFLDTYFGYNEGDTLNKTIALRSDAINLGNGNTAQIGISVYTPQYVTIQVGTDVTITTFIDTNSRYTYGSETYEGVLFTLPFIAINKDFTISGAGNIKSINHMENLNLSLILFADAKKLTNISITNSDNLTSIEAGSNTFLRSINLSGSKRLSGNLNLTNCVNLQKINVSDTALTSVTLPDGGNLKSFLAANCSITNVAFKELQFLNEIDISNCNDIRSYEMYNCPLITDVNIAGYYNLTQLIISNCQNVESLHLANTNLSNLSVTSCDSLSTIDLSSCSGSVMSSLNLSTIYGLTSLTLNSAAPSSGITVYLPLYDKKYASLTSDEITELIAQGTDVYWHNLTTFSANSSTLKNLVSGIQTITSQGTCDFTKLTKITSLGLRSCNSITKIVGLQFTGSLASLFYDSQYITSISGKLVSTTTNASSLFNRCYRLYDINNLELDLHLVTNADGIFSAASCIQYADLDRVLYLMPNLTSIGSFLWGGGASYTTNYGTAQTLVLKADLFRNNPKLSNLNSAFLGTPIASIPNGFFDPIANSLTSLNATFYGCGSLTSVPNNLIKNCVNLNNVTAMFQGCGNLTSIFTSGNYYDIFPENSKITSTVSMFFNCGKIKPATTAGDASHGLDKLFKNLPNVTNINNMFYGNSWITQIPNGIFTYNTKLQDADLVFANCTGITTVPSYLFYNTTEPTTTTHPNLTIMRALFSGCTNMTGTIRATFYSGAYNLQYIGRVVNKVITGPTYVHGGGDFANTKVIGYEYNFLYKLPNLVDASFLFFKGTISGATFTPKYNNDNSTVLQYVYIESNTHTNLMSNDLLKNNTKLQNAAYMFAGNTSFTSFIDESGETVNSPTLFRNCKSTLTNAEGLFAECTGLGINVPSELFKNCARLSTLKSAFANCTSLSGTLPSDFLNGCTSLGYTHYMFFNCTNLGASDKGSDTSIKSTIFDSCRGSISNTAYMFAGCGFNGKIGTGIGSITNEGGVNKYNISQKGLLADCTSLVSTEGMFRCCKTLKGAIPADLFFTTEASNNYMNLTNISYMFDNCVQMASNFTEFGVDGRNKASVYGDELQADDGGYLIPQNWLVRCPNITTIVSIFNHVSHPQEAVAGMTVPQTKIMDTSFNIQTKLQNITCAFAHCKALTGTITSTFMQNSLNTLTEAGRAFAYCNLSQVGSDRYYAVFEKSTSTDAKNTMLRNLNYTFYGTYNSAMRGYAPTLSRFTALTNTDYMLGGQTSSNILNFGEFTSVQVGTTSAYWDQSDRASYDINSYNVSAS